jgi:hypothetical protein
MTINNIEISVTGNLLRVAKLRHEWFEHLDEPSALIEQLRRKASADLFTFLQEAHVPRPEFSFHKEIASASVLTVASYKDWWENLHFKARNKARKAQKMGVEIRAAELNDDLVRGIGRIYNESPLRQGRKFIHYGKDAVTIKSDLSSFPGQTFFVGAYFKGELIGFMKLFEGSGILRTVHIIAMLAHRDKCVMDALIARAVQICDEKKIQHLHYGDWAYRGLGAFRSKYDFRRHDCPRYFVPLTARGKLALKLKLHVPLKDRLPRGWVDYFAGVRESWNSWRYDAQKFALES